MLCLVLNFVQLSKTFFLQKLKRAKFEWPSFIPLSSRLLEKSSFENPETLSAWKTDSRQQMWVVAKKQLNFIFVHDIHELESEIAA